MSSLQFPVRWPGVDPRRRELLRVEFAGRAGLYDEEAPARDAVSERRGHHPHPGPGARPPEALVGQVPAPRVLAVLHPPVARLLRQRGVCRQGDTDTVRSLHCGLLNHLRARAGLATSPSPEGVGPVSVSAHGWPVCISAGTCRVRTRYLSSNLPTLSNTSPAQTQARGHIFSQTQWSIQLYHRVLTREVLLNAACESVLRR